MSALTTSPAARHRAWNVAEVGLHFEADKIINDKLLTYFSSRPFEIHYELGPRIEIDQRTNSWSRVHGVVLYSALDDKLVDTLAKRPARMITVLRRYWMSSMANRQSKIQILSDRRARRGDRMISRRMHH